MNSLPRDYTGEMAGVATALLWTATSLLFSVAGRRIGPTAVNLTRLSFAIVLLAITHRAWSGNWVPDVGARQVAFLAVSGAIGLAIGDQALFHAFLDIGPRLSTLIMTTSPIFAASFGYMVLGESLGRLGLVGMVMTIGGVSWAVLERRPRPVAGAPSRTARGVALALVGAVCQGGGLLLSKQGMGHGWLPAGERLDPQAATLVRVVFAALAMMPIVAIRHQLIRRRRSVPSPEPKRSDRIGYVLACCGAVAGPYLGVWMSLVAGDRAPIGVAQTLCSMTPIFILPAVAIIHREPVSLRAVAGALVAVGGCAVLFVR
ncbi:MAG: DMT family transporter [Phycisphaerales bacterium]|nr:DMT family transporter [Phycisphaerales bacterium]